MAEYQKSIVIDGHGHLLGRLASAVAKQLLRGQHITVVRAEDILISGPKMRNKLRFMAFLNKRCNVRPSHGAIHYRSPHRIFWRTVRGMLPHKTARGALALSHLTVYNGVPPNVEKQKRMVCPAAVKVLKLQSHRKFTVLGELSAEVGWKQADVVKGLEEKRKIRGAAYFAKAKELAAAKAKAVEAAAAKHPEAVKQLAGFGYTIA